MINRAAAARMQELDLRVCSVSSVCSSHLKYAHVVPHPQLVQWICPVLIDVACDVMHPSHTGNKVPELRRRCTCEVLQLDIMCS